MIASDGGKVTQWYSAEALPKRNNFSLNTACRLWGVDSSFKPIVTRVKMPRQLYKSIFLSTRFQVANRWKTRGHFSGGERPPPADGKWADEQWPLENGHFIFQQTLFSFSNTRRSNGGPVNIAQCRPPDHPHSITTAGIRITGEHQ